MADQANIPAHSPGQQGGVKNQQATNTPAPLGDGGPAFPVPMIPADQSGGFTDVEWQGLSLRDYFAAKAMQALIAAGNGYNKPTQHDVARGAYAVADAMLAARKAVGQ